MTFRIRIGVRPAYSYNLPADEFRQQIFEKLKSKEVAIFLTYNLHCCSV